MTDGGEAMSRLVSVLGTSSSRPSVPGDGKVCRGELVEWSV